VSKKLFLMKPHHARPDNVLPGMEWSIKLDGIRAWWDGGVSRGSNDAPWQPGVNATGLWTNNSKPIYAPDWWLDQMPPFMCDGELWAGPGRMRFVQSVCRRKTPDNRWTDIKFVHHTDVDLNSFLDKRVIREKNCTAVVTPEMADYFLRPTMQPLEPGTVYELLDWHDVPYTDTWDTLREILNELLLNGHEGIVIRKKDLVWTPERVWDMVKWKPFRDMEVTVVGVVSGNETDKGSTHRGRMAALRCVFRGKYFHVSGFNHNVRKLVSTMEGCDAEEFAYDHPGEELPSFIEAEHFPNGSKITIKYQELTDRGVPRDPRFWRKHFE